MMGEDLIVDGRVHGQIISKGSQCGRWGIHEFGEMGTLGWPPRHKPLQVLTGVPGLYGETASVAAELAQFVSLRW